MKSAVAFLAAAATFEQASATFFNLGSSWLNAKPFTPPCLTENYCNQQQQQGWNWAGVQPGKKVSSYGGCSLSGLLGGGSLLKKRYELSGRATNINIEDGFVTGDASSDLANTPSITAGPEMGAFSVDNVTISCGFDTRMEFHYEMPDGSMCKMTHDCPKAGTSVTNTQCGGAKKLYFVHPEQNDSKSKRTFACPIMLSKMLFNCKPNQTPVSSPVQTTPSVQTSASVQITPSEQATSVQTTPSEQPSSSVQTSLSEQTTTSIQTSPSAQSTPSDQSTCVVTSVATVSSCNAEVPQCSTVASGSSVVFTTTTPATGTDCTAVPPSSETSVPPSSRNSTTSSQSSSSPSSEISSPPSSQSSLPSNTPVSSAQTTCVVTSASTISSCGPQISECAGVASGSSVVVTKTVPATGAECITTEIPSLSTQTPPTPDTPDTTCVVVTVSTVSKSGASTVVTQTVPASGSDCAKAGTTPLAASTQPPQTGTATSPDQPEQTDSMPCPPVVPQCLNTFMYLKQECKSNMDTACYCPSPDFVQNIFDCLYAHGESGDVIASAVSFFQGICAPYVNKNPCIATGAQTITSIITVTSVPHITSADYTTIMVSGPVSNGVVPTAITVPQVDLPTAGPGAPTGVPGSNPGMPSPNPGAIPGINPGQNPAPTGASQNPGTPGSNPETPGQNPGTPGSNPKTPGQNPSTPGSNPEAPGQNPGTPGSTPETPGQNPGTPGSTPEAPGQNPGTPGSTPETPGQNPGMGGQNPGTPGSNSEMPGSNPSTSGSNPAEEPGMNPGQNPESTGVSPAPNPAASPDSGMNPSVNPGSQVGTGGLTMPPKQTGTPQIAGASRMSGSLGFGIAVMAVVVAM